MMSRITKMRYEEASDEIREEIDNLVQKNGRITNMKSTLLHSLPAYRALMQWYPLRDEAAGFLTDREITFFCYAISTQNDCLLCTAFFQKVLDDLGIDFAAFDFTQREDLLISYAKALASHPHDIADALFASLKQKFTEGQIVLITAFGSIMIATNLINTALEVELDDYLAGYAGGMKNGQ